MIRALREFADFLETRPEIPVRPQYHTVPYNVFADGTDAEKFAQVDYVSTLLGTKVKDETPDGGHYLTGISLGSIEYRFVAIPKEPIERPSAVFEAGQEVCLASEVARNYRRNGIPQAGVIISQQPEENAYLVRLPGRISMSFPGSILEPASFGPVVTSRGEIRALADAEAALTTALAESRFSQSRGEAVGGLVARDAEMLAAELGRACGLRTQTLIGLLEGAIETEAGKLQAAQRTTLREGAAVPALACNPELRAPEAVRGRRDDAAAARRISRRGR